MKRYTIVMVILFPILAACQPLSINGKIFNHNGQPVPGATITLKRTGANTTSSANGEFSFPVSLITDTIIVSALGYETAKEPNNERGQIIIYLKPKITSLQEVIINTGYETIPRERSTGSFTIINNNLLQQQVSTDIISRLEAVANSVSVFKRFSSGGQLMVRGLSTIIGTRDPLIILDNFPYEGPITNINPNDIESVTILKDAASASIWGTKAGNGVIVITTKKGTFHQKPVVEFNTNFTFQNKPDLFYLSQISSSDFIDVEQFLFEKGFYNSRISANNRPSLTPVVEILIKKRDGTLSAAQADAQINALRSNDIRNEFLNHLYQPSVNQQYSASVRGGSEIMAWKLFTGFDHNRGQLNDIYQRFNLNSDNAYKLGERVNINTNVSITFYENKEGKPSHTQFIPGNGVLPPYISFGNHENPIPVMKDYRQPFIDTTGGGKLLNWNYYPLTDHLYRHITSNGLHLVLNSAFKYKISNSLSADLKYQFENGRSTGESLYDEQSYYTRNLINLYTQINPTSGQPIYKIPRGDILDIENNNLNVHNLRSQLLFNNSGLQNKFIGLAGFEIRQSKTQTISNRTYGFNNDILTSGAVDLTTAYPLFITGSSFIPDPSDFTGKLHRFISFFANAAYTYNDKYTITISGRRDASNLFGVSTNDKWTPLWSAGLAWNISQEKIYASSLIPYLRARITYGLSGNVDQSRSGVSTIQYLGNSQFTQSPTARPERYYNPNLRWEKTAITNLALDFKTAKNTISGSIEWYRKKSDDLYSNTLIDYTNVSTNRIIANVASLKASGIDIDLQSVNINGIFKWLTHLNFNYNSDKVTKYYLSNLQGSNFISNGRSISGLENHPVFSMYSYKWAGLNPGNGNPQGIFKNEISTNYTDLTGSSTLITDLYYHGPAMPTIFGSLGNTISYKNISLTARLTYKFNYFFRKNSIDYFLLFYDRRGHADFAKRWQQPGDEKITNVPALIYPDNNNRNSFYTGSEIHIEKGDHIRLQYLHLNYQMLKNKIKNLPFETLNVFIAANNLGIIWKATKSHFDPEYNPDQIPLSKNYSFGIRTGF